MSSPSNIDLGLKDIRFLKAVRDINEVPENYPKTEGGKMPASKTAIRESSSLSEGVVEYRFEKPAKIRTDGEYGLVEILPPTIKDKGGYGPKSAKLTDKGAKVLGAELDERDMLASGVAPGELEADGELEATVASLKEQVSMLEAQVSELQDDVQEIQQSPTGALNRNEQRAFEALADAMPAYNRILKALDVGIGQVGDVEEIDSEEVRQRVRRALADENVGQSESGSDEGVSDETTERVEDGTTPDGEGDQAAFGSLQADPE